MSANNNGPRCLVSALLSPALVPRSARRLTRREMLRAYKTPPDLARNSMLSAYPLIARPSDSAPALALARIPAPGTAIFSCAPQSAPALPAAQRAHTPSPFAIGQVRKSTAAHPGSWQPHTPEVYRRRDALSPLSPPAAARCLRGDQRVRRAARLTHW